MTDFYSVLANALVRVGAQDDFERDDVYDHVRRVMVRQLLGYRPALSQEEIDERVASFDAAIARIEFEVTHALPLPEDFAEPEPLRPGPAPVYVRSRLREVEVEAIVEPHAVTTPLGDPPPPDEEELAPLWATPPIDLAWDETTAQWQEPASAPAAGGEDWLEPAKGAAMDGAAAGGHFAGREARRVRQPGDEVDGRQRPARARRRRREREPAAPRRVESEPGETVFPAAEQPTGDLEAEERADDQFAAGFTASPIARSRPSEPAVRSRPKARRAAAAAAERRPLGRRLVVYGLIAAALAIAGWSAYVLLPIFLSNGAVGSAGSSQSIVVFGGTDPSIFNGGSENLVRFQGDAEGGFVRITSSASGARARASIGPGITGRLEGKTVVVEVEARGPVLRPSTELRIGYQRGDQLLGWASASLEAAYQPLTYTFVIPAGAASSQDYLLIEPGLPGDATSVDIRAIRLAVTD